MEPKNVLITRLSAIGDCISTIPLAVRVKQLWPNCKLTWIVDCGVWQLLESHPAVDELIKIEKRWLKRPMEWATLRRELRSRRFDVALDPQGLTKSALLSWLSGATQRVGFDYSQAREVAPLVATKRVTRTARHMVDTYLQLLEPWCTTPLGTGEYKMPTYADAAESAESILSELGLAGRKWVAINPGAGWTTRLWPVQRFGMLAREIYREHGRHSLVFWAGESELLMAKVISEESRGAALLAPATGLTEMMELLRRSSLLVTSETGPMHMASAIGAPCVSLHGPTWSDESGPYGNRHLAIQSPMSPTPRKISRKGPNFAMQAIEFDDVIRACERMFYGESASQSAAA